MSMRVCESVCVIMCVRVRVCVRVHAVARAFVRAFVKIFHLSHKYHLSVYSVWFFHHGVDLHTA